MNVKFLYHKIKIIIYLYYLTIHIYNINIFKNIYKNIYKNINIIINIILIELFLFYKYKKKLYI